MTDCLYARNYKRTVCEIWKCQLKLEENTGNCLKILWIGTQTQVIVSDDTEATWQKKLSTVTCTIFISRIMMWKCCNQVWFFIFNSQAILVGDYILSVSSLLLAQLRNEEVVKILSQVIEDLVRGKQILDSGITVNKY